MPRSLSFLLLLLFLFSTLTGCASKYGKQETVVNYYPACYDPIKKLRDSEHDVATSTGMGVGLGVLGGALLGALATGKVEGAVVGGVAGGAVGGVAGNMIAKKRQIADENARMSSYLADLDGDISNLDIVSASARTSLQCYERQFNLLIAQFKQRRITKEQLERMYAEIRSGTREATNMLGAAVANGRDLERQYNEALAYESRTLSGNAPAQRGGSTRGQVAQRKRPASREASASLHKAQTRRTELSRKVDGVAAEKAAAEKRDAEQNSEVAELIAAARA